jgi:hypothetical protein
MNTMPRPCAFSKMVTFTSGLECPTCCGLAMLHHWHCQRHRQRPCPPDRPAPKPAIMPSVVTLGRNGWRERAKTGSGELQLGNHRWGDQQNEAKFANLSWPWALLRGRSSLARLAAVDLVRAAG